MNGRILIVDDVATNRVVYRARLAASFYEPLLAADGAACLAMAREARPDLILLDLTLPDISATEVMKRLRAAPQTRDIPVIVLTAASDLAARMTAFSAGADDVMTKPVSEAMLLARVRNLLRSRGDATLSTPEQMPVPGFAEPVATFEKGATIALLAPRGEASLHWKSELQAQTRDRVVIMSRSQALAEPGAGNAGGSDVPDVFIVQDDSAGLQGGLRMLSELKSHMSTRHSAVCLIGPPDDSAAAAMAFDLGADDVVAPDIRGPELALRVRSLLRRKRQGDRQRASLQDNLRLAMIDPLTGLHNRRYAMPKLAAIAAQAAAEAMDYAVMVVDLDKFKLVNDRHGHAVGDQVLIEVAQRLTSNLRITDVLARIGGEEFLIVLPRTPMPEARQVAERLCEAVEEMPIRLASGEALHVTVSIGVAVAAAGQERRGAVDSLVEQADLALLDSKSSGRNQVTFRLTAA
jgi:two-component system, cell cycle response regulator